MDMRLVIAVQGLTGISALECGVLVALATCRDHRTGICNPSIERVAALSHYSKRAVIKAIGSLRVKGVLEVMRQLARRGDRNSYRFCVNTALVDMGGLGECGSPVHEVHPIGERGSPKRVNEVRRLGERGSPERYIKDNLKDNVCVGGTRTQDILEHCVHGLRGAVPGGYVRDRFEVLERTGWTLPDGRKVAPDGFAAHCLAWWRAERDRERWLADEREAERVARISSRLTARDWGLCRERCAHCLDGGGCACGVRIPPDMSAPRAFPPEECSHYRAKGGVVAA